MNYQVVRAKHLALAWQLKMLGSFSRELEQYSYNDQAASLVAFGEISISACNDSHSSQATSTLGNTPNLNIRLGSQTKETLHWFPDRESNPGRVGESRFPNQGNPTRVWGKVISSCKEEIISPLYLYLYLLYSKLFFHSSYVITHPLTISTLTDISSLHGPIGL